MSLTSHLTTDVMLENPEELIGGMKIILQLFDNAKGILGIEDNKPDCIEKPHRAHKG